jgi:hypothetical protein
MQVTCPECGLVNYGGRRTCKRCKAPLEGAEAQTAPIVAASGALLSLDERREILEREVSKLSRQGWRVVSRTDTSAQLEMQKQANGCLGLILLLFFIIPGILYFVLYKGTKGLYIEVQADGRVRRAES